MLDAITRKKQEKSITNIKTVRSFPQSANLPMAVLDKVLLVDVYHEFEFPREMMNSIHESLKRDGMVYLIEYRKEDPNVPIKELHKMSEAQAVKEMYAAGFELVQNISNLPWQHCMIFRKR
jgi:predicted methyltransferase